MFFFSCSETAQEDLSEELVKATAGIMNNEVDLHYSSIGSQYIICVAAENDATLRTIDTKYTGDIIGEIRLFEGNEPPANWMICDGKRLEIEDYPTLFGLIVVNFGGDGRQTFQLPDLRGRIPVGTENVGTTGKQGGEETLAYTNDERKSISIQQPYLTINYIIRAVKSEYDHDKNVDELTSDVGEIKMYAGGIRGDDSNASGYFPCNGKMLKIFEYQDLNLVINNKFGGDGRVDFSIPDLRLKTLIQYDDAREIGNNVGSNKKDIQSGINEYSNLSASVIVNFQVEKKKQMMRIFLAENFPNSSAVELSKNESFTDRFILGAGQGNGLSAFEEGKTYGAKTFDLPTVEE